MAGKSNVPARKTAKAPATPGGTPIKMVVRRGAVQRFQNLKKKTAHLDVEVVWDQRDGDRRRGAALSAEERRLRERRRTPPFTWDVADFVVATPAKAGARKRTKAR